MNNQRQFIFVGSSMQNTLVERLQQMFPDIVDLKDEDHYSVIPKNIKHEEIYIDSDIDDIKLLIELL